MKRRKWKFTIAVMGLTIMAVFCGCGSNSAEKVAVESCSTTLQMDIDGYYELLAPPYIKYMVEDDGWYKDDDDFKETIAEYADDKREGIINKCGDDFKSEFEVIETDEYSEDRLERLKESLASDYGYDEEDIDAAASITVGIRAYGNEGGGEWTSEEDCVKVNGKWYLHRPGFN